MVTIYILLKLFIMFVLFVIDNNYLLDMLCSSIPFENGDRSAEELLKKINYCLVIILWISTIFGMESEVQNLESVLLHLPMCLENCRCY